MHIEIPLSMMTRETGRELFIEDCRDLLRDVGKEYMDRTFGDRLHTSDATYMDGCRGPLCMAAHRIAGRKRSGAEPTPWWAEMEPVLLHIGEQFRLGREARIAEIKELFATSTTIALPADKTVLEGLKAR